MLFLDEFIYHFTCDKLCRNSILKTFGCNIFVILFGRVVTEKDNTKE